MPQTQMDRFSLVGLWLLAIASLCIGSPVIAQIVPDDTLGNERSRVTPNAPVRGGAADRIDGGAQRGANLFHSFREFNVGNGQRIYFANPADVRNILTRVTGNNLSNIQGTLGVDGSANLFLLNPNGIVFGANARLDISGSFVGSTANRFTFSDGSEFSATNPQTTPLLTVNVPVGVQFGTPATGTISNMGNLTTGQDLTLSGNRLALQGQLWAGRNLTLQAQDVLQIRDSATNPFIAAAGGQMVVQGNRAVDIFALNHSNSGLFSGGDMVLRSANTVGGDARYWSGGNFRIERLDGKLGDLYSPYDPVILVAGNLFLNNYIGASLHILAGGFVYIPGTVTITSADINSTALVENVTLSDGTKLSVDGIARPTLDIRAGVDLSGITIPGGISIIGSGSFPGGADFDTVPFDAGILLGQVNIIPPNGLVFLTNQYEPNLLLPSAGVGITGSGTTRTGNASPVRGIDARGFGGNGSSVVIDSRGTIFLREQASIDASSNLGNAGNIKLTAGESISLGSIASLLSSTSTGRSGNITLNASEISLDPSASIITSGGGDIQIRGDRLLMQPFSNIANPAEGNQNAGNIFIQTNDSVRVDRGNIGTVVFPGASGNAGNIEIKTGELSLIGDDLTVRGQRFTGGDITSDTTGDSSAGNITVNARRINILNGAQIRANAGAGAFPIGRGNGGSIDIRASELLQLSGRSPNNSETFSRISSSTYNSGAAGNVNVVVDNGNLIVRDAGFIQSQVQLGSSGTGGNVTVRANNIILESGGQISAGTFGTGRGGTLTVNAGESVRVTGTNGSGSPSGLFTATYGYGDADDLTINTRRLSVLAGGEISSSTIGIDTGKGGDLTVNASDSVEVAGTSGSEDDPFYSIITTASGLLLGIIFEGSVGDGGDLTINTGQLTVRDSGILSSEAFGTGKDPDSLGQAGNAGDTIINANRVVVQSDGEITTSTDGPGGAGNLIITAPGSVQLNGGNLRTRTSGSGNAGDLIITTGQLTAQNGEASAATRRGGRGGNVSVTVAGTTELMGSAGGLGSLSLVGGDAGDLTLRTNRLIVRDGAGISSESIGRGRAGNLTIIAPASVEVRGGAFRTGAKANSSISDFVNRPTGFDPNQTYFFPSRISAAVGSVSPDTPAANLSIRTGQLTVRNGGEISTQTLGYSPGGRLSINAPRIDIIGNSGNLRSDIESSPSALSAQAISDGNAGNISISTQQLNVRDNAEVTINSSGTAPAGNLQVIANSVSLDQGRLKADTASSQGGNIELNIADSLQLNHNSQITASTQTGQGGNVTINSSNAVALRDRSRISAEATSSGRAGNLTINTNELNLNNATATVTSRQGQAGNLSITAEQVQLDNSRLAAATRQNGNGANIQLQDLDLLLLRQGSQIDANAGQQADGGNININSQFIVAAPAENNDITANAGAGNGGRVNITTEGVFGIAAQPQLTAQSDITATSEQGVQGIVTINRPDVDPSRGLIELPTVPVDATNQIAQACPTNTEEADRLGSFIVSGRGGLPPSPTDLLNDDNTLTEWVTSSPEARTAGEVPASPSYPTLVEAQGWVKRENGEIQLVAAPTTSSTLNSQNCQLVSNP